LGAIHHEETTMNLQLEGKTAVITGSTAGIGFAAALALAREGASVVVNGRTQDRVDAAVWRIRSALPEPKVRGVAADLSTSEGVGRLVEDVALCDILVNNLGIFEPKPFLEIRDEDWFRFFQVNVMSGVRLSRAYLPGMVERGFGRIVFVSSESGVQIPAEMIHYGMTKTAQIAVARGIAESVAGTGVTVNTVLPGPTASEGVGAFVEELAKTRGQSREAVEAEFFRTTRPTSLIKRFLTPEEVASMIAYLASPLAAGTTGAALRVDGGVVRAIA
jgi:NAD(P)-dependent dehydrogenase (short-subunit alcohol dehydrogenase family)